MAWRVVAIFCCGPRAAIRVPFVGLPALLLILFLALPSPVRTQNNPTRGTIRGQVADKMSEARLPGAEVEFLDELRRVRASTVTDDTGYFILSRLPPGPFQLRVRQLGYILTTTPVWWVQSGEVLDVMVWMRPDAIPLAPLEVVGLTRTHLPVLGGFYRRMANGVGGVFLDRDEIDERNASRITDLLVDVPGIRIETTLDMGGTSRMVTFGRSLLAPGGGRCVVQVFVDGVLATRGSAGVPLDDLATPNGLEGIEIYRGLGTVPPEFVTPNARCGVIALWTRRGHAVPGRPDGTRDNSPISHPFRSPR